MDLTGSKILAMCLLGGISIFLGFIPLKLGKLFKGRDGSPRHGTIFSGLLCFGGGVLLGTSLLHLLPEVIKIYNYLIKTNMLWGIPRICNAYYIICLICFPGPRKFWTCWNFIRKVWAYPIRWSNIDDRIFLDIFHWRIRALPLWFWSPCEWPRPCRWTTDRYKKKKTECWDS